MKINICILFIIYFINIYLMAEPRRDSFGIKNNRDNYISIEISYMNSINIYDQWTATFYYGENPVRIQGISHIYEGNKNLRANSYQDIFDYPLTIAILDEEKNLSYIEFIDSIPYVERLRRILRILIIKDENENILLTLDDINNDMIKGSDGYYFIEIF